MPKVGMEPIRRAAVINAALECVCDIGLDAVTLDMVASRAGCSKGVIAYYFKTKKNLMLESLKAFLSFYQKAIQSKLNPKMTAGEMIKIVLDEALPPIEKDQENRNQDINVADLYGIDAMNIPLAKKARLFVQFFSQTMLNAEFQTVIQQVYGNDIQGIAAILDHGNKTNVQTGTDTVKAAYGLLAMVVGLSFFRVTDIQLPEIKDNRVVCTDYLMDTLNK